jgi:hypothetical protein
VGSIVHQVRVIEMTLKYVVHHYRGQWDASRMGDLIQGLTYDRSCDCASCAEVRAFKYDNYWFAYARALKLRKINPKAEE